MSTPGPRPDFSVVGAEPAPACASPTLRLKLAIAEATERRVYSISLRCQIMVEAAARGYAPEVREQLTELFGEPGSTPPRLALARVDVLTPSFVGATEVDLDVPCHADLDLGVARYAGALDDGHLPLKLQMSGSVMYEGDDGRLQVVLLPWNRDCSYALPVSVWRATLQAFYGDRQWVGVSPANVARLKRHQADRGLPTLDAAVASLLDAAAPSLPPLPEEMLGTLLYEGYALYPYTPGATKNATPTPFGIVYPPAYAAQHDSTFDHLQAECEVDAEPGAVVEARVRFLQPSGPRHEALEREVALPPVSLDAPRRRQREFQFQGDDGSLTGRLAVEVRPAEPGRAVVTARLSNTSGLPRADVERPEALRRSLLSAHVVLRVSEGRFVSPLETPECRNVNTWPVLASEADDVVVGAAIILPDHPQIAPESVGDLFDGTEIEEALVLHVQALSDEEREQLVAQDPRVRRAVERVMQIQPDEVLSLHGRMRPASEKVPGDQEATVDGQTFRRGGQVRLRLAHRKHDPYAPLLDGCEATVERIYRGLDDRVYLGLTIAQDPGRDLLRESGRFLYFFSDEVEVLPP